ncbi:TPA: hypothetical protein ACG4NT_002186 [Stenotrophomonas maltophilia]
MDDACSKPDRACQALASGGVAVPCQRSECAARQHRPQREGGLHLPAATMPSEHEHQGDQQRASRHGCPARGRLEQIPAKRCAINLGKRHSHDARGLEDDIEPGEHETGYGTRQ